MKTMSLLSALLLSAGAAQAQVLVTTAALTGAAENPANGSAGTGFATVSYDIAAHTLQVDVTFSGLTGTTTAAHIHAPVTEPGGNANVATQTPSFTGFPSGVTSGTYSHLFDLTDTATYRAQFVTDSGGTAGTAEFLLGTSLAAGTAYLNIHTSAFGGGEIRGFLTPVPEPVTTTVATAGVLGAVAAYRLRRRNARG